MITIGIDEVGRGCWAGPLVAGAVILPEDVRLPSNVKLRDSKKLSKAQRETTAAWVHEHALAVGLGWVEPDEVDNVGLTEAVRLAMHRAVEAISVAYDEIIVDGNINYFVEDSRAQALIKADDSVLSVSAASIVAKVARDNHMAKVAVEYPGYGFEKHVGYGTALHVEGLRKIGVSNIHRKSYKPIQAYLTT
jgi:ribonuclease HII